MEDDPDDREIVDVTLIDAVLALTPEQRLQQNDRMVQTIQELRDGFAKAHDRETTPTQRGRGRTWPLTSSGSRSTST